MRKNTYNCSPLTEVETCMNSDGDHREAVTDCFGLKGRIRKDMDYDKFTGMGLRNRND